jgi:hypothetical protein
VLPLVPDNGACVVASKHDKPAASSHKVMHYDHRLRFLSLGVWQGAGQVWGPLPVFPALFLGTTLRPRKVMVNVPENCASE